MAAAFQSDSAEAATSKEHPGGGSEGGGRHMGGAGHVERGCFYASEGRSRLSCLACSRACSRSEGAWEKGQSRVLTWSRPSLEPKRPGQDEAL